MEIKCSKSPDGIHGIAGGVRGSEVRCVFCNQLDEKETEKARKWWNGKHEKDCLCSKCIPLNKTKEAPYKSRTKNESLIN